MMFEAWLQLRGEAPPERRIGASSGAASSPFTTSVVDRANASASCPSLAANRAREPAEERALMSLPTEQSQGSVVDTAVDQLLEAHPPSTTERRAFLEAQYDAGLAWVSFPIGIRGGWPPRQCCRSA